MTPAEACCLTMKAQLGYQCDDHGLECPDIVLRYSEDYDNFSLYAPNSVQYACFFCPWCGTKLRDPDLDES